MSVAATATCPLARNANLILEVLGEAIDASTAEQAPLIASSGLPTGDLAEALAAQIADLTTLRTRLVVLLANYSSGTMDAEGRSVLLADLLHFLKAVRIAIYDLVLNGVAAHMTESAVITQCQRYANLDALLRERIIPDLSLAVSLDGD